MRLNFVLRVPIYVSLVALSACSSALGPSATLVLSTPPDFSARVSKIEYESANGPAGPYSQYNVWVIIPPAANANAGVVIPAKMPVFARHNGQVFSSTANNIKVDDLIEVWHSISVAYGAVQGPPGAPTYESTQIVIDR
jgi:hypothetical protein